jgi:hypothetical protein
LWCAACWISCATALPVVRPSNTMTAQAMIQTMDLKNGVRIGRRGDATGSRLPKRPGDRQRNFRRASCVGFYRVPFGSDRDPIRHNRHRAFPLIAHRAKFEQHFNRSPDSLKSNLSCGPHPLGFAHSYRQSSEMLSADSRRTETCLSWFRTPS